MEKQLISDTFYYIEMKDQENRLIRTVVFRLESGMYEAFSSYFPTIDGNIIGFASGKNDRQVVILSLEDFDKELKLVHKLKTAAKKVTTDYFANGDNMTDYERSLL
ncbi:hypothetical protein [Neobacillus mesonae]|uniref:hypothetical protein n=1 Tax=Neobacillus mesonae TaxID=1193713 RepID=UPI0020424F78|nr:hypothetical protein [Neobacillus mesonae]MCM3571412.1 hypothetical protein [Neobacillus mesonae]